MLRFIELKNFRIGFNEIKSLLLVYFKEKSNNIILKVNKDLGLLENI